MNIITNACVNWIKNYFESTGGKKAVIGISGGKDSTVAAALCVKALGNENVIGVLMPNGEQADIADSKEVCKILNIDYCEYNIEDIYKSIENTLCENYKHFDLNNHNQAKINLFPRIRTTLLYAVAQCIDGGRVCNTSNKCELFVGWGTHAGDIMGDFSPLGDLTVSQVCDIGQDLGLPLSLVMKTPSDGLTGKSDEENLGVKYKDIENFINGEFDEMSQDVFDNIYKRHKLNKFKTDIINVPKFKFNEVIK